MINYEGRSFKLVFNTENGETSGDIIFKYRQAGNIITSEYAGGTIKYGHLMGLVDDKGNIEMAYHHVNEKGIIMTGICKSTPETIANGKIRLHELWEWTSGDKSKGQSILEEI